MRYSVLVKPGSKKGPLVEMGTESGLIVYVRDRAVDGKANIAVSELLAKHFGVSKTSVVIVRGHASRYKVVDVK
jgi:uncharacterized protein YggU (UPF0235/DUF167 family)